MSYRFIQEHQAQYPVRVISRVLGVAVSGYYRWQQQPQSQRAQANQRLLREIEMVHQQSRQIYGSPKIQQTLRQQSIRCGRNRII